MSEYDDRQPHSGAGRTQGAPHDEVAKMRDEAMSEMWRDLKRKIRKLIGREEESKEPGARH